MKWQVEFIEGPRWMAEVEADTEEAAKAEAEKVYAEHFTGEGQGRTMEEVEQQDSVIVSVLKV